MSIDDDDNEISLKVGFDDEVAKASSMTNAEIQQALYELIERERIEIFTDDERHVLVQPEVLSGSPYVRGSRVPVRRIFSFYQAGVSVDRILKRYPQLGAAKVLDALAFALDNPEVMEADFERERALLNGGQL